MLGRYFGVRVAVVVVGICLILLFGCAYTTTGDATVIFYRQIDMQTTIQPAEAASAPAPADSI